MAKANKAKVDEYRSLDDAALADRIADEEMQMKKLAFNHAVNPIENPLMLRSMRRNIARLKTEQSKRSLGK